MAIIYPTLENIQRLKTPPTPGEWALIIYLKEHLDNTYEVFFNPYLDGDRPDIIILRENCCAFVIEVKDWNLRNYAISENNKWSVCDGYKSSIKSSPQSQAFKYKKNLYDLHLPVIGLAKITNKNFYNLVHCFVYFHNSDKSAIDLLYGASEDKQREAQLKLHRALQGKKITFNQYDETRMRLSRNIRNLQRDKSMCYSDDRKNYLVAKIQKNSKHVLFEEKIYQDFKRRLSPPTHTLHQGLPIKFDKKQLTLIHSNNEKGKIKGVAGCGKTSILAQRAINANQRNQSPVLILTFNITLKNYIRDKISDIQGSRDSSSFEISNYHQFFNAQINNTGQDFDELIKQHGIKNLYFTDIFYDTETIKYQTILVDEIQDYQSEWVGIIRENFLDKDGEMILFGDESQNIYQTDFSKNLITMNGFGKWIKLTRSYRANLDSPLNDLFKGFQLEFLLAKNSDMEITEVSNQQTSLELSLLKYEEISASEWKESTLKSIRDYIIKYRLSPNDIVILSSKISLLRELNEQIIKYEKTHCMFETHQDLAECTSINIIDINKMSENEINTLVIQYKSDIENIRRVKKNHFYANSGLIKLSTTHSYKGLESKTVFYLMTEEDDIEIVYTSITRSAENIIVLDIGGNNKCSNFLKKSMN